MIFICPPRDPELITSNHMVCILPLSSDEKVEQSHHTMSLCLAWELGSEKRLAQNILLNCVTDECIKKVVHVDHRVFCIGTFSAIHWTPIIF